MPEMARPLLGERAAVHLTVTPRPLDPVTAP